MRSDRIIFYGLLPILLLSCEVVTFEEVLNRENVSAIYLGNHFANQKYRQSLEMNCVKLQAEHIDAFYNLFQDYAYVESHPTGGNEMSVDLDIHLSDGTKRYINIFQKYDVDEAYMAIYQGLNPPIIKLHNVGDRFSEFANIIEDVVEENRDCHITYPVLTQTSSNNIQLPPNQRPSAFISGNPPYLKSAPPDTHHPYLQPNGPPPTVSSASKTLTTMSLYDALGLYGYGHVGFLP